MQQVSVNRLMVIFFYLLMVPKLLLTCTPRDCASNPLWIPLVSRTKPSLIYVLVLLWDKKVETAYSATQESFLCSTSETAFFSAETTLSGTQPQLNKLIADFSLQLFYDVLHKQIIQIFSSLFCHVPDSVPDNKKVKLPCYFSPTPEQVVWKYTHWLLLFRQSEITYNSNHCLKKKR